MRFLLPVLGVFLCISLSAQDPFLRISQLQTGGDCLQVAVRRYAVGEGSEAITVQLVGVSHIGSENYYQAVQEILDAADVVLFEGVDGNQPAFLQATVEQSPEHSSLQMNLARALELVFQLHAINYNQPHFINSDVTSVQLMALFEGKEMPASGPAAQAQMEQLLAGMEEASLSGQAAAAVLNMLELHPDWRRGLRWGMVKILGSVTGNVAAYPGFPEELRVMMTVLIEKRNEKVMQDLHAQLAGMPPGETVAVFYGAAHMHDFELRLQDEMQAKLLDTQWLTAFCGNLQRSGLNLVEKKTLAWFVNQQVRALKIIASPARQEEDALENESAR